MKEYDMRGTYEAYILVKVKGGQHYVCALNRRKATGKNTEKLSLKEKQTYLHTQVIWN